MVVIYSYFLRRETELEMSYLAFVRKTKGLRGVDHMSNTSRFFSRLQRKRPRIMRRAGLRYVSMCALEVTGHVEAGNFKLLFAKYNII
jgi:hypothetical protein